MVAGNFAQVRVAVLDEGRHFQVLLRTMLRHLGIRDVDTFADPVRAAAHVRDVAVDVAFVGPLAPGRTGLHWAHDVRHGASLANPDMAIVLTTARAARSVVEMCILAGVDDLLVRPFAPDVLGRHLGRLVGQPPAYVSGPSGYWGPEIGPRLRRLDPLERERRRRRRVLAEVARVPASPQTPPRLSVPGLDVEISKRTGYGGEALYLD